MIIVLENQSLTIVEDIVSKYVLWYKYEVSKNIVRHIVVKKAKSNEDRIIQEMNEIKRGTIMHNRWSKCDIQYLYFFACYFFENKSKDRLL